MADIIIKEWPASFYNESNKTWIKGMLALLSSQLTFLSDDELVHHVIWFEDICAIHCEKCSLVFNAITIEVGKVKYWFSSLPNQLVVYNHLEHFWREQLLPETRSTATSKIGKDILNLVYDSQSTLEFAANKLQNQGKQIDHVTSMMSDIHGSLDTADRLLSNLESWVGQWYSSRDSKTLDYKFPKQVLTEGKTREFVVLYIPGDSPLTKEPDCIGILQFNSTWIKLLNAQQANIFHFDSKLISSIHVITPWVMVLKGSSSGQVEKCYSITCSKLILVLQGLESFYQDKIHYESPQNIKRALSKQGFACRSLKHSDKGSAHCSASSQVQECNQTVTQSEADEISKLIGNMKSMALDIAKETEMQNETLDNLIPSVDKANAKMIKSIKRMDKPM